MPRYSETSYGLKPAAGPRSPANAQPIASAPQASPRPIGIFEPERKIVRCDVLQGRVAENRDRARPVFWGHAYDGRDR